MMRSAVLLASASKLMTACNKRCTKMRERVQGRQQNVPLCGVLVTFWAEHGDAHREIAVTFSIYLPDLFQKAKQTA